MAIMEIRFKKEATMKKIYLKPSMEVVKTTTAMMICGSEVKSSGTADDIDYGGVDEEGELDPASRRRRRDVWEDEELDEEEEEY